MSITHSQLLNIVNQRHLTGVQREDRRKLVFQHLIRNSKLIGSGNFAAISSEDLGTLFHAIDENYFDGTVSALCEETAASPLKFRLSTRMTSSGGMTTMHRQTGFGRRKKYEIAVATTPLFETFKLDSSARVGGLECRNRLEALQRIMEHELIHLIEMLLWEHSNCSA